MEKIIVLVGTNASGKSTLAVELAKLYNGEVISADSRQVYAGLDIATGKITKEEMDGIPHHLLDVAHPQEVYTAADFARDGRTALIDIISRGKLPILAGGTGFYIDALLHPEMLAAVPPNEALRAALEQKSSEELFSRLEKLDPVRAENLRDKNEQNHRRRLVRAIEIALTPAHKTPQSVKYDILWIGISWEKDVLEERIRERTHQRMQQGMIEEAKQLHRNGISYERMEALGLEYTHLANYLRQRISKEELIENIIISDRQYAKRQRTWFKRNKQIHWFTQERLKDVPSLVRTFLSEAGDEGIEPPTSVLETEIIPLN
tara:strand:+ start:40692 stop:41648 length:957 start_codon:yes stop_codon:yes gene_type:complete